MKFNFWTFLFQVVNFFVLLYILWKVLYRPVREMIEKRRRLVQETIDAAEKMKAEAEELKQHYMTGSEMLENLRTKITDEAQAEAERNRLKLLQKAKEEAAGMIEKEKTIIAAERREAEAELKLQTIEAVAAYATRLMNDVADHDLHKALCRRFLHDISQKALVPSELMRESTSPVVGLRTAYPLDDGELSDFKTGIESVVNRKVEIRVTPDSSLIAGVKVKIGDMAYDASLAGQIDILHSKLKAES